MFSAFLPGHMHAYILLYLLNITDAFPGSILSLRVVNSVAEVLPVSVVVNLSV